MKPLAAIATHIRSVYSQPARRGDARFGPTHWRERPTEPAQLCFPWALPAPPRRARAWFAAAVAGSLGALARMGL